MNISAHPINTLEFDDKATHVFVMNPQPKPNEALKQAELINAFLNEFRFKDAFAVKQFALKLREFGKALDAHELSDLDDNGELIIQSAQDLYESLRDLGVGL